jgi:hypothetical protein
MPDRQLIQWPNDYPAGLACRAESVAGDLIGWEFSADQIAIEYLHDVEGTLSEWAGAVDDEAYGELWK